MKYDKLEHFLLAMLGMLLGLLISDWIAWPQWLPASCVFGLGFGYEVYNGIHPYDGVNIQGFSRMDLIADIAGMFAGWGLYHLLINVF